MDLKTYQRLCDKCRTPLNLSMDDQNQLVQFTCPECTHVEKLSTRLLCKRCKVGVLRFQKELEEDTRGCKVTCYIYKCDTCGRLTDYDEELELME